MRKPLWTLAVLVAISPLLMGAGMAPPTHPPDARIVGPLIRGVMVVDTHPDDTTTVNSGGVTAGPKAKYAALFLQRAGHFASTIFRLPAVFGAFLGCDPLLTGQRFAFLATKPNKLKDFVPAPIIAQLFQDLGIDLDRKGDPAITAVLDPTCTADPENPGVTAPGILSFRLRIEFVKP